MEEVSNNNWTKLPNKKECPSCLIGDMKLEANEDTARQVTYYYKCRNYKCRNTEDVD